MENNIDKYFRKLSEEQKPKSFPNMDNIWDKVEEKLDEKKQKRIIPLWKYIGVAAALLLLITLGSRFINHKNPELETTDIVVIEEEKIREEFDSSKNSETLVYDEVNSSKDQSSERSIVNYETPVQVEKEVFSDNSYDDFSEKSDYSSVNLDELKDKNSSTTIKGVVISAEDGLPLPGATVIVQGTTNGTQTDLDGNFSLQAEKGQEVEISYIGMEKQNLVIGRANQFNVALVQDNRVGDVVTMEYGMAKKYPVIGQTIKEEHLEIKTVTGIVVNSKSGLPLENIIVKVQKTDKITKTDSNGRYTIEAEKGDKLEFSSDGMKTKVIKVKKSSVIDVELFVL